MHRAWLCKHDRMATVSPNVVHIYIYIQRGRGRDRLNDSLKVRLLTQLSHVRVIPYSMLAAVVCITCTTSCDTSCCLFNSYVAHMCMPNHLYIEMHIGIVTPNGIDTAGTYAINECNTHTQSNSYITSATKTMPIL